MRWMGEGCSRTAGEILPGYVHTRHEMKDVENETMKELRGL